MGPNAQPSAPAAGIVFGKGGVQNKRTGVGFNPSAINGGGAAGAGLVKPGLPPGTRHNTDPLHPALAGHPDVGTHAGIEGGTTGAQSSAHPSRSLAGPPPVLPTPADDKDAEHQRAKDLIEHKAKIEAKYGRPDPGVAKAEAYKQKQADKDKADKEKADQAKADEKAKQDKADAADKQKQSEADAKQRHDEHTALLKGLADSQKQIAEHLGKPKPKVVIKRDAKGNAVSFEPQG